MDKGLIWPVGEPFAAYFPPHYVCSLGYDVWYLLTGAYPAYHTGADFVFPAGGGKGSPLHAIGAGRVIFAANVEGTTWGNLVVIQIPWGTGHLYARYAHLDAVDVRAGQTVRRGQTIGTLGDSFGRFYPHLHFDLSPTERLASVPWYWPGPDERGVLDHFIDPIRFIRSNHAMSDYDAFRASLAVRPASNRVLCLVEGDFNPYVASVSDFQAAPVPPEPATIKKYVACSDGVTMNVRPSPGTSQERVSTLGRGDELDCYPDEVTADTFTWLRLYKINGLKVDPTVTWWVATKWLSDTVPPK